MSRLATTAFTVCGLVKSVGAGTWQQSDFSQVTNVGGVFATAANECYAAVSDNSKGPGVEFSADSGDSWTFNGPYGSVNTDTAHDLIGNSVITTIGATFISQKNGPYTKVEGKGISFSQNVETLGENQFAVSGTHYPNGVVGEVINGVALTTDAGNTWSYHDTGLPWDTYVARYSAFPTKDTWYVAQGSWVSSSSSDIALRTNISTWQVNSRVHSTGDSVQFHQAPSMDVNFGAISKTTDGGKTFIKVYDTKGLYYMNSIDCVSAEICMAVAEDAYNAIAIRTENGGKTWDTVLSLSDSKMASLMGCKMLSENEVWLSGGTFSGGLVGWYYHSVDAGKTWELQSLEKGYSIDLSFSGGVGYSPAMSEVGSTVAVYK